MLPPSVRNYSIPLFRQRTGQGDRLNRPALAQPGRGTLRYGGETECHAEPPPDDDWSKPLK